MPGIPASGTLGSGLESIRSINGRQLFRDFGAIFSIDLADGLDCFDVLNRMEVVVASSNLGDTRTLAIPVAHTIYHEMGPERRASMGIADNMIRFSVGMEDQADLLADFAAGLGP
ncbi:MAG: PLP-dependent transferase [Pseudohongiellaceae bacterium]